jgi:hypothetical protein
MSNQRLIEEIRATLAAQTDRDPSTNPVVGNALRSLVKLEVIPNLERELAAEHAKPLLDRAAIAALTAEIYALYAGQIPDHVRDALLQS